MQTDEVHAQTVVVQTCVRTGGGDAILEGALGLPDGTWFFGYDVAEQKMMAIWQPSSPPPSSLEMTKVVVRVWNLESSIISSDMRSGRVHPVVEKSWDLTEDTSMEERVSLRLDKYLIFEVEGSGPAVGQTVSNVF